MSSCYRCLEPFTNNVDGNSSTEVSFSCDHKICMECLPDAMRNQEKLDTFEINCSFSDCNGTLPIERIPTLPKNENYERIMTELFLLIGNTNNIRNITKENSLKNHFQMALSDHCPNCKKLTIELENVDACSVITCEGCMTKFCKACMYHMSHEAYLIYRNMVPHPIDHETIIANHINNFHNQRITFLNYEFIKPIQKNEKLYKIQELGRIHTIEEKENILSSHDIQQLIRNVNEKYDLEIGTIESIYLGTYNQTFSSMSDINHYGLLRENQPREAQMLNLINVPREIYPWDIFINILEKGTFLILLVCEAFNIGYDTAVTTNAANAANAVFTEVTKDVVVSKTATLTAAKTSLATSKVVVGAKTATAATATATKTITTAATVVKTAAAAAPLAAVPVAATSISTATVVAASTFGVSTGISAAGLSAVTASAATATATTAGVTATTTGVTAITGITLTAGTSTVATTTALTGASIACLSVGIGILFTLPVITGIYLFGRNKMVKNK